MHPKARTLPLAVCLAAVSSLALAASSDRDFALKALQGDNSETRLGEMAEQHATSQGVRDFGRMLREDHSKSRTEVLPVARSLGLQPTEAMAPEAQKEAKKLERLSGRAFDREFASYMVKDHKKDIADFRREAAKGSDPAARRLAEQTIPVLEHHLDTAQRLKSSL